MASWSDGMSVRSFSLKRLRCFVGIHNSVTRKMMRNWVERPGYFLRCRDCGRIVRGAQ